MSVHFRTITQDELTQWIFSILKEHEMEFPKNFNWSNELIKNGFKPEFVNINFHVMKNKLNSKIYLLSNDAIAAWKLDNIFNHSLWTGQFSNIRYFNCSDMRFSSDGYYDNCTFEKCTIFTTIRDSNFSKCLFKEVIFFDVDIIACDFDKTIMDHCKFTNSRFRCINLGGENNFRIINSEIVSSEFERVNGLERNELSSPSHFDENCKFKNINSNNYLANDKPIVVMLYSYNDGVRNAEMMIEFYKKYNFNLILVSPKKGMAHPVFNRPELIRGIILPGGPDVPLDDNDLRKKFEIELLNLACKEKEPSEKTKMPVLGICRGHQFIGSRYGGVIQDIPDDDDEQHQQDIPYDDEQHQQEDTIFVKPKKGSLIYQRLDEKYKRMEEKKDENDKTVLNKDHKGRYAYDSISMNTQMVVFDKTRDKENVMITAKSGDGIVQAMQINKHIFTFQHHHERFLNANPEAATVARALLKIFATKVMEYDNQQKNIEQKSNESNAHGDAAQLRRAQEIFEKIEFDESSDHEDENVPCNMEIHQQANTALEANKSSNLMEKNKDITAGTDPIDKLKSSSEKPKIDAHSHKIDNSTRLIDESSGIKLVPHTEEKESNSLAPASTSQAPQPPLQTPRPPIEVPDSSQAQSSARLFYHADEGLNPTKVPEIKETKEDKPSLLPRGKKG